MSPKAKQFDTSEIPARVDRVIFTGISRTKDDILATLTKPIREETKTFLDLFLQAHQLRHNLLGLNGSFKSVQVVIDSTPGENSPNGYDVKVVVRESRPIIGRVDTSLSPYQSNSGTICTGIQASNVLGRGESVTFDYTTGTKGSLNGFTLSSTKPIVRPSEYIFPTISTCIYQSQYDFLPSLFSSQERGIACELVTWPLDILRSTLRLEANWRSITSMAASPFAIRELSGHYLKTCVRNSLDYDTRSFDHRGLSINFPTSGWLLNQTTELAGFGGNQTFLKTDFHAQSNGRVPGTGLLVQAIARAGIIATRGSDLAISEKFFLGGPLSLRGFHFNGVGPSTVSPSDPDKKYALGANSYWLTGLHLYSPLPFLGHTSQPANLIYRCLRLHTFFNAGSSSATVTGLSTSPIRTSIGAGLAIQAGPRIRLEVNFVKPLTYNSLTDSVKKGVDLGFGITFS